MKYHWSLRKFHQITKKDLHRSWWKILVTAILLGVLVSLLPRAYCTLADCSSKDKWCNEDCLQPCGPTQGLGAIVGCSRGAYGCIEDWIPDAWGMRCMNGNDCKVTECASNPPGYGCFLAGDGLWDVGKCSAYPSCQRQTKIIQESCCGSKPTPCPKAEPKIITDVLQPTPEFPLVSGQDPNQRGMTITSITVIGGEHDCQPGRITAISVKISLSEESVSWIEGELTRRYPGAHVLDSYPLTPVLKTTGLNTHTATASIHFDPKDPGDYAVTVTALQDDGQVAHKVFRVHVALYESTIRN